MRKIATICLTLISFVAFAGGNPEHVVYPEGYKANFTNYDTRNRVGKPQVAVMYANKAALSSANSSKLDEGSIIVMEVYKAMIGEDGKPVVGAGGVYEKGKFAAVAVMEKRSNWDAAFNANDRTGDWGYAIYKTDGSVKKNKLDCAGCHSPISETDFLFSHSSFVEFLKK